MDEVNVIEHKLSFYTAGALSNIWPCYKINVKIQLVLTVKCLYFRQLIYNYPEQLFADSGVMAIEHADFDGIERLALVTGGEIVSTFDQPDKVKLGKCNVIEEVMLLNQCFVLV